jgi:predicted ATPase
MLDKMHAVTYHKATLFHNNNTQMTAAIRHSRTEKPMLKRVKIQGYKSLEDVEVYLQPLSVFFGPNASGKSNFLDALQLLSRITTSNNLNDAFRPPYRGTPLESFTFGANGIKELLVKEHVSFTFEVDIEVSQRAIDTVSKLTTTDTAFRDALENVKNLRQTMWRYRITIEVQPRSGLLNIVDESLNELNLEGEHTTRRIWMGRDRLDLQWEGGGIHFDSKMNSSMFLTPYSIPLSALKPYWPLLTIHQELSNWFIYYPEPRDRMRIPSPVREVRLIGLRGEEVDAFLNTLRNLDEPQFRAIEKALHVIVPSFTGIDVGVNTLGEVELSLMQGQTPISVSALSEGTLRILGLLALASMKEPPYLIGIEEPENGIHPHRLDLIATLLQTRASDDTQVIATTHSPILVDLIPKKSLYAFRRVNGKTAIDSLTHLEEQRYKRGSRSDFEGTSTSKRILRGDFNV